MSYAADLLQADAGGAIYLYDPNTRLLTLTEGSGLAAQHVGTQLEPGEGLSGRVLVSGQSMAIDDHRTWEGKSPKYAGTDYRAVLAVPLRWQDQIIGVLNLTARAEGRRFTAEDVQLAELFAAQAAAAIGNARLLEAERRARQQADTVREMVLALSSITHLDDILEHVLAACAHLLDVTTGAVMVLRDGPPGAIALYGYPLEQQEAIRQAMREALQDNPLMIRLAHTREPIILPDVREEPGWARLPGVTIRSWLGVPLLTRGGPIGLLLLDSDRPGAFTAEHAQIGQALAAHAAVAIDNTRLFDAAQRALADQEEMLQASQALIAARTPRALLQAVAQPALQRSASHAVLLYSAGADGGAEVFEVIAALSAPGHPSVPVGRRFHRDDFRLGAYLAAHPGELAIIEDIDASDLVDEALRQARVDPTSRAFVIIPLHSGGSWAGLLTVSWPTPHHFTDSERRFYRVIAPQLAAILEIQRLLEATRQAEVRFRDVALSTSDWVWETDLNGTITYCSEQVEQAMGYPAGEVLGRNIFEALPPADRWPVRRLFLQALRQRQAVRQINLTVLRRDGQPVPLMLSAVPVLDAGGQPAGFRGVARDVTAERQAEQREQLALDIGRQITGVLELADLARVVARRVQAAFDLYHVRLYLYDEQDQTLVLSEGAGEAGGELARVHPTLPLGARPSLIALSARTRQPVISNDTDSDPNYLATPLLPDTRAEAAFPLVRGERLLGVLDAQATGLGHFDAAEVRALEIVAAYLAVAIDNAYMYRDLERHTQHLEDLVVERTEQIVEERERLRAIVESAGDGIMFLNLDGLIKYVNPAWERLTGYAADRALGRFTREIFIPNRQRIEQQRAALAAGEVWQGEVQLRRPDGGELDMALTLAPVTDRHGALANAVGVLRDISAQKHLERMRQQFMASVSHELRTPLTNIKLFHSLAEKGLPERREGYLRTMGAEIERLERLVTDLLDMSRLDRGAMPMYPRPLDLNQLVTRVLAVQQARAAEAGLTLQTDLAEGLPRVYGDSERLEQVLVNLVNNAINYSQPGGTLGVQTRLADAAGLPSLALVVWDTGIGIAPSDLPFIFDRFFRAEVVKQEGISGTGLGLAIVREILELHGGSIRVESTPGHGTTFIVTLPAAPDSPPAADSAGG